MKIEYFEPNPYNPVIEARILDLDWCGSNEIPCIVVMVKRAGYNAPDFNEMYYFNKITMIDAINKCKVIL